MDSDTRPEVGYFFDDPISGQSCLLVIPAGGEVFPQDGEPKIGVLHPRCATTADLAVELDAFWCPACHWNGRISGQWAVDMIEQALAPAPASPAPGEETPA